MKIITIGASLFGNMTKGGGLSAIFDESAATVGYAEYSSGWAGVSLLAPKRVNSVELTSYSNGFDSSGQSSTITMQLRAKNGGAPTLSGDGVLLGSISFIDQNTTRSVTVESYDKSTEYTHIWIVVTCGVWATLVGASFEEAPEISTDVEPLPAGSHVFLSACNQTLPLSKAGVELYPVRTRVVLSEPRHVLMDFHGDVIHVGSGTDASIAVGWSFWIAMRQAESIDELPGQPFAMVKNALGGGNVSERNPQHYGNRTIGTAAGNLTARNKPVEKLPAGVYEFTAFGNCHTDGSLTDSLVHVLSENGQGLNCLRVTVLP